MFWDVLGAIVPLAVIAMISPMPIVAATAIMVGPRGTVNVVAYAITLTVATFLLTWIFATGAQGAAEAGGGPVKTLISIVLSVALALLFFVMAYRSFRGRPKHGQTPQAPKWLGATDSFGPVRSAGLGALLSIANVKNLSIMIAAGHEIGDAELSWLMTLEIVIIFAVLCSLGVLVPMFARLFGSQHVQSFFESAKDGMIRYNAIIMTVLFTVLGSLQLGSALEAF